MSKHPGLLAADTAAADGRPSEGKPKSAVSRRTRNRLLRMKSLAHQVEQPLAHALTRAEEEEMVRGEVKLETEARAHLKGVLEARLAEMRQVVDGHMREFNQIRLRVDSKISEARHLQVEVAAGERMIGATRQTSDRASRAQRVEALALEHRQAAQAEDQMREAMRESETLEMMAKRLAEFASVNSLRLKKMERKCAELSVEYDRAQEHHRKICEAERQALQELDKVEAYTEEKRRQHKRQLQLRREVIEAFENEQIAVSHVEEAYDEEMDLLKERHLKQNATWWSMARYKRLQTKLVQFGAEPPARATESRAEGEAPPEADGRVAAGARRKWLAPSDAFKDRLIASLSRPPSESICVHTSLSSRNSVGARVDSGTRSKSLPASPSKSHIDRVRALKTARLSEGPPASSLPLEISRLARGPFARAMALVYHKAGVADCEKVLEEMDHWQRTAASLRMHRASMQRRYHKLAAAHSALSGELHDLKEASQPEGGGEELDNVSSAKRLHMKLQPAVAHKDHIHAKYVARAKLIFDATCSLKSLMALFSYPAAISSRGSRSRGASDDESEGSNAGDAADDEREEDWAKLLYGHFAEDVDSVLERCEAFSEQLLLMASGSWHRSVGSSLDLNVASSPVAKDDLSQADGSDASEDGTPERQESMSDAAGMKPVFRMVSTHNTRIQVAGEDDPGGGQDDEDEKERRRRRIPAHRRLLRKSVTVDLLDREAHKLQSSDIIQAAVHSRAAAERANASSAPTCQRRGSTQELGLPAATINELASRISPKYVLRSARPVVCSMRSSTEESCIEDSAKTRQAGRCCNQRCRPRPSSAGPKAKPVQIKRLPFY
ncbi:hypothetical protein AB1Y20_008948 [Prymnesium parvum]|uniref:Uncharacterized protein n=1 Tax=Prymnesium parvum TaxID=97485 RepID=A0AB34K392_PRYPA